MKNATATYARALTHVLRGLIWKRCVLYCDDSVIWGEGFDDHMDALHQVLKRYSIHNVNIKIEKCHFACNKTEFVGHEVEVGKGVRVDPKKVKAMVEMQRPQNVMELKSFIGKASYYKRFIANFAHLALPLRRIENVFKSKMMSINSLWGPNQERRFVALKATLSEAPVLVYPDFSKPFIVVSDCSDVAKGATLAQMVDGVERPILYMSQALNDHELRYGITDNLGGVRSNMGHTSDQGAPKRGSGRAHHRPLCTALTGQGWTDEEHATAEVCDGSVRVFVDHQAQGRSTDAPC